jgi:hypothetical protein
MRSVKDYVNRHRATEGFPPAGDVSVRNLLEHATGHPDGSVRQLLLTDAIGQYYDQTGRSRGPVGIPLKNVRLIPAGAAQAFSGGYLLAVDDKVEPVVVHQAKVRFLGFVCHEESNELSASDEPYFVVSVSSMQRNVTTTFGPYEDVDAGEKTFVSGAQGLLVTDVQPPFVISVMAKEHDEGDPETAATRVRTFCDDAIRDTQLVAIALHQPQVAAVTVVLSNLFTVLGGAISDAITGAFGLDDDFVGSGSDSIGDYDEPSEVWATPPLISEEPRFTDDPYNVRIDLGEDGEGRYSLFFNVEMFRINTQYLPPVP